MEDQGLTTEEWLGQNADAAFPVLELLALRIAEDPKACKKVVDFAAQVHYESSNPYVNLSWLNDQPMGDDRPDPKEYITIEVEGMSKVILTAFLKILGRE